MSEVLLAGGLFLLTHLGISSTPARGVLVGALGQTGYLGLYSLLAFATLGYLIWAYGDASRMSYYWLPDPRLYWVPKITMMLATIMMVGAFMVRNATQIGQEGAMGETARGLIRITRHPFQWAVVLWSVSHIAANGDEASVVFFASIGLLSLIGTFAIDRKKAGSDDWAQFAAQTSNVPFLAILQGRNRLEVGELLAPVAVGAVVYLAFFWGHEWLSGVAIFW